MNYYDDTTNYSDAKMGTSYEQRKRLKSTFVKTGQTFLQMRRPHFDADALIYKAARHGIRKIRKAVGNHRKNNMFRSREA